MMRSIINIAGFQAGWFSAVLGAGNNMPWLGLVIMPVVLLVHILLAPERKAEAIIIITAGFIGFWVDTLLVYGGVFTPVQYLLPEPFSPPWMVLLWMGFATSINVSLKNLHGRYLLSSLLGAFGGPSAYYGGAKLGAASMLPGAGELIILAVTWAAAVPSLFYIASKIREKYEAERA